MSIKVFFVTCLFLANNSSVFANQKHPVILLSIDGFANSYLEKYQPTNILALAKSGVRAEALLPIYPSKTFPNHLSIVTGLYPAKHGILHNHFYRPDLKKEYTLGAGKYNANWLTALPIWTVAEQQGIKTGVYFWPESEAKLSNILPSHYYPYKHETPNIDRINQLVNWLKLDADVRPQLLISYFSTVDSAGHMFGPNSKQVKAAIEDIDQLIGLLLHKIRNEVKQKVNIVLVSDHGMTITNGSIDINSTILPNDDLKVVNGQTQLFIYGNSQESVFDARSQLLINLKHDSKQRYSIFLKSEFPKHWHFDTELNAIPDIIVEAKPPYTFTDKKEQYGLATHGYDPKNNRSLDAIFIASGPDFKSNKTISAFENIHIYPMLTEVLGVNSTSKIDGNINVLQSILQK